MGSVEETIIDGCLDDDVVTATSMKSNCCQGRQRDWLLHCGNIWSGIVRWQKRLATFRDSADTAVVTWFDEFGIDNSRRTPTVEIEERALAHCARHFAWPGLYNISTRILRLDAAFVRPLRRYKAAQSTDAHTDIVKSRNKKNIL